MSLPEENRKYTYADYLTWPTDERWEIIDGMPYMQSALSWQHQKVSGELYRQISNGLFGSSCMIFAAPFDLRIPEKEEKDEETAFVVQPDLVVICDKAGLKGTGYSGTPAMVIEITLPSTNKRDRLDKFNKYEKAGVEEYWIVEPEAKLISVFALQRDGRYGRPEIYSEQGRIHLGMFPDLTVDLDAVFKDI
ncbi:Uma2 family endonuclease [Desulfitobacterium chlororespirans]|uniref:Endonuclease, Uma2 family (Restriction endonuclease fold) n=1 Tax=Desulfitobacterium chlororespirans DSM 11544 TaxID=1121395 RepID=A0A1M7TNS7_9FIRM|nr:Uma2 family endonuclease [Desulfitobacterium chlororespirans]SHN72401.1 Endonuclease, Uma2 family (restriction endonuclease fold) [Desulfitobacterium chlororespirans DSM 11544]